MNPHPTSESPDTEPRDVSGVAALLNLSSIGLGYLYLGRVVHTIVAWVVVFLLAVCSSAAMVSPILWIIMAVVWTLGTALHGAMIAGESRPLFLRFPGWLAAIIAVGILVSCAVGGVLARNHGRDVVAEATAAHAADDCERALARLRVLNPLHLSTYGGGDVFEVANAERAQCRALLQARAEATDGDHLAALQHYARYLVEDGIVDTGSEIGDVFHGVEGLVEAGEHCRALGPVGYLAVPQGTHEQAIEETGEADDEAPAVFGQLHEAARALHPVVLFGCAQDHYEAGNLAAAEEPARTLWTIYPEHELNAEDAPVFEAIVSELTISDIEAATSGPYNPLGGEQATGTAPAGEALLVLGQDGPSILGGDIEVLYAGPQAGRVTIPPDRRCGFDTVSVTLPPGMYEIVVQAGGDVPPLYGIWDLQEATRHLGCFEYGRELRTD